MLTIIGNLDVDHSDILVRNAFQCLQLVFADFLPTIPYRCYPQCVETAAKFGAQKAELNVSLTAIGLLWNLSDYFYQNVTSLQDQVRRMVSSFLRWKIFCRVQSSNFKRKSHLGKLIWVNYYFEVIVSEQKLKKMKRSSSKRPTINTVI